MIELKNQKFIIAFAADRKSGSVRVRIQRVQPLAMAYAVLTPPTRTKMAHGGLELIGKLEPTGGTVVCGADSHLFEQLIKYTIVVVLEKGFGDGLKFLDQLFLGVDAC